MNGAFGLLVPLGILAYLYTRGSKSPSIVETPAKSVASTPIRNTNTSSSPSIVETPAKSVAPTQIRNTDTHSSNPGGQGNSYSTTGEFARSTEGFIPNDKCECGGEWVKHVNKTTGGRFFGCSRYPRCENTRDKQQAKNFCSNGHSRTNQNTAYNSDGSRRCLVCRPLVKESSSDSYREFQAARPSSAPSSNVSSFYCRNGHKRTSENTYVRPDGERECRVCRRNAR